MQPIVVQKYGGSSVADAERIRMVAARIARTCQMGKRVCVVVSAMGTTTNELLAKARQISESPSRRELDMLLSCGERAAMALLSMAVHELGLEAVSLTGSLSGILTNDRHSGARIIEIRPVRVMDELDRGRIVIVAGFQGVSYKREITTLGRGGSDTTAVALAAALGAEYCEICSDVDGVYTADPKLVGAAQLIDAISHDKMLELAAHGAKVLHPEAVEAARRLGVAVYARATNQDGAGTRIDRDSAGRADRVAGVTGHKGLVRLVAEGLGGASRLLGLAAREHLPMQDLRVEPTRASLVLSLDDVPDWTAVKTRLALADPSTTIEEGLGAVSVVGDFVGKDAELVTQILALIGDASACWVSTSPLRVTVYCEGGAVDGLVRDLHQHLREAA